MYLVKSCHGKDHISSRRTLKLGSLYGYREIEQEMLRDEGEGTFEFRISLDGEVEVDRLWFNTIFARAIHFGDGNEKVEEFPGYFSAHIEHIHMVTMSDDKVILKDSSAHISRGALNSFVFCISELEDPSKAPGIFDGYDSYWSIPSDEARNFALASSQSLLDTIQKRRLAGDHVIPPEVNMDELSIYVRHERVQYIERDLHINEGNKSSLDSFMKIMHDMSFVKPPRFSKEHEYRFSYTLVEKDQIIQPLTRDIVIPADEILSMVNAD